MCVYLLRASSVNIFLTFFMWVFYSQDYQQSTDVCVLLRQFVNEIVQAQILNLSPRMSVFSVEMDKYLSFWWGALPLGPTGGLLWPKDPDIFR